MMVEALKDMAIKKKHIKAIIQLRRAKEQEWIELDPILRVGEPALSTDVYKLKIGDGIHQWHEIPYLTSTELMELAEELREEFDVEAGNGLVKNGAELSLDSLILDCGTSTTNVEV